MVEEPDIKLIFVTFLRMYSLKYICIRAYTYLTNKGIYVRHLDEHMFHG